MEKMEIMLLYLTPVSQSVGSGWIFDTVMVFTPTSFINSFSSKVFFKRNHPIFQSWPISTIGSPFLIWINIMKLTWNLDSDSPEPGNSQAHPAGDGNLDSIPLHCVALPLHFDPWSSPIIFTFLFDQVNSIIKNIYINPSFIFLSSYFYFGILSPHFHSPRVRFFPLPFAFCGGQDLLTMHQIIRDGLLTAWADHPIQLTFSAFHASFRTLMTWPAFHPFSSIILCINLFSQWVPIAHLAKPCQCAPLPLFPIPGVDWWC